MTYPITNTEALAILPGLEVSTTDNSVSSGNLAQLISDKTDEVLNVAYPRRYLANTLTNHQKDLLSLISQVRIWKDVIARRLLNTAPSLYAKFTEIIGTIQSYLDKALKCLYLNKSWKTPTIPSIQLATDAECCTAMNLPTPSASTKPSNTIINLWSTQWSAVIYSYAATLGNFPIEAVKTDLPDKVLAYYADTVSMLVGCLIMIVHSSEFDNPKPSYDNAMYLWNDGIEKLENLRKNKALFILSL